MTDAPKIDTQAPVWLDLMGFGAQITCMDYAPRLSDSTEWEGQYVRRDLSAAREAAAAQAMREALMPAIKANCRICGGTGYSGGSGGTGSAKTTLYPCGHGVSHITSPTDPAAALDRLIAERVREAVEAEREACATIIDDRCKEILDKQDGTIPQVDTNLRMMAILLPDLSDAIRARGSKEGQS